MEDSDSSFSLSCLLCKESEVCFNEDDDNEEEIVIDDDLFINLDDEYIQMLTEREKDSSFGLNRNVGSSSSSLDVSMMITQDWFKCARLDAIRWILKTRGFFGFRFQTAYLSMTYFDRFLSERPIDGEKIWAIRLLSIACLSLAAKMEECRVPTLSEFQIEEYNFESKVIQRMELLVLNTLKWRMDSITPFVYLHYFIIKLNDDVSPPPKDLASISTQLVLAIIREMNLMDHPPSAIAAAAVLAASNKRLTRKMVELKIGLISSFGSIQNEHVFSCYRLMQVLEMEKKSKIPKFVISPDLSSIYSTTSMDVHEEEDSLSSPTRTKKRRLNEYDQNCGMLNEKRLH